MTQTQRDITIGGVLKALIYFPVILLIHTCLLKPFVCDKVESIELGFGNKSKILKSSQLLQVLAFEPERFAKIDADKTTRVGRKEIAGSKIANESDAGKARIV